MDMETFVTECRECDITDGAKVRELLDYASQMGEAIIRAREKSSKIPYQEITEMYNNICVNLPKVCKLTNERKNRIKSCFAQKYTLQDFEAVFRAAESTPFLLGDNERGWHATFDWIIKPQNMAKVLEGNYKQAEKKPCKNSSFDLELYMKHAKNNTPKI